MHLSDFVVDDLIACSQGFAECSEAATTMQEVAQRLCHYLYGGLRAADGGPGCALVRLYKTHRVADLPPDDRRAAEAAASEPIVRGTRCLTLLGTAGGEPAWNDRCRSVGHRVIPLTSEAVVEQSPMIAHLLAQLGMDVADVVRPDPVLSIGRHHESYDVFYVPEAAGSPAVPAQDDFVEPYGIRSVVGGGGVLPSGDLFVLIAFSLEPVPERTADLFRSLIMSVKRAIVPFTFAAFDA